MGKKHIQKKNVLLLQSSDLTTKKILIFPRSSFSLEHMQQLCMYHYNSHQAGGKCIRKPKNQFPTSSCGLRLMI